MSIGLGTTWGVASTDKIQVNSLVVPAKVTIAFSHYFSSAPSSLSRYIDASNVSSIRRAMWATGSTSMIFAQGWSITQPQWTFPNNTAGVANRWNNFVIRYDGSSYLNDPVIFINGVKQTHSSKSATPGSSETLLTNITQGMNYGNRSAGDRSINCIMGDIGHWDRILTDDECYGLSNGISPRLYPRNLNYYFRGVRSNMLHFNDGGYTATLTGTLVQPHGRSIGI